MTPAQPLLPFFPTFAALERAAKPGGPGNGAGNGARNEAREPARREARVPSGIRSRFHPHRTPSEWSF